MGLSMNEKQNTAIEGTGPRWPAEKEREMANAEMTKAFNRSDHFLSMGRRAEELGNTELAKMCFARSVHWWSIFANLSENTEGN